MSLLRHRATDRSVSETLSALRPAAARLRLVSATRAFSEADEKELLSHAAAGAGEATAMTLLSAKAATSMVARRRCADRVERDRDIRIVRLHWRRSGLGGGLRCGHHRRRQVRTGLRRDGPGRCRPGYRRVRRGLWRRCPVWCG